MSGIYFPMNLLPLYGRQDLLPWWRTRGDAKTSLRAAFFWSLRLIQQRRTMDRFQHCTAPHFFTEYFRNRASTKGRCGNP